MLPNIFVETDFFFFFWIVWLVECLKEQQLFERDFFVAL